MADKNNIPSSGFFAGNGQSGTDNSSINRETVNGNQQPVIDEFSSQMRNQSPHGSNRPSLRGNSLIDLIRNNILDVVCISITIIAIIIVGFNFRTIIDRLYVIILALIKSGIVLLITVGIAVYIFRRFTRRF